MVVVVVQNDSDVHDKRVVVGYITRSSFASLRHQRWMALTSPTKIEQTRVFRHTVGPISDKFWLAHTRRVSGRPVNAAKPSNS